MKFQTVLFYLTLSIALHLNVASAIDGPVARWSGEGNANDAIGANNGTLHNGVSFVPGKLGQAFSFDGADDYISFGSGIGNFGTNDFTVDFWIKTTAERL